MADLDSEGLILVNTVAFEEVDDAAGNIREVHVHGRVETPHGGVLTVNKWLHVYNLHGRLSVRTREYDYHAYVRRHSGRSDVFRYDNCHGGIETLHRHAFDAEGSEVSRTVIESEAMPPLAFVIRETEFYAAYLAAH